MQRAHQILALRDGGAQMRRARRKIGVVQVIGLDPALDERPHQRAERLGVIVDAAQQHRLLQHRNAGIDQTRAGGARFRASSRG